MHPEQERYRHLGEIATRAAAEAWQRLTSFEPSTDVDTDYVVIAE